jgi:hypothetical protein
MPRELKEAGKAGLDRVRLIRTSEARDPAAEEISGYRVVADHLWRAQHHKCAYCEKKIGLSFQDVEHYRPKTRADRGHQFPSHGYWWLAWHWANLLYACPACNRSAKGTKFPLKTGSVALAPEMLPPGAERPWLIDPGDSAWSPVTAIGYAEDQYGQWVPEGLTPEGLMSIRILELDSDELVTLYTEHVRECLIPEVWEVSLAWRAADRTGAVLKWDAALRWLSPRRPFTALSWHALRRKRNELGLPRSLFGLRYV